MLPRSDATKSAMEEEGMSGERKEKSGPASVERRARHLGSCREKPGQRRKDGLRAHTSDGDIAAAAIVENNC